ncbi:hypothetical protein CB1_000672026 [Camelus ferus]|nr:hypothetical protein CB1_000672026 [Camelus ferus]
MVGELQTARRAELHEAAAGAETAEGTASLSSGRSPAVAQTVAGTARSVLATGREGGAGLWATGSGLSSRSRSAATEAAEFGFRRPSIPTTTTTVTLPAQG